MTITYAGHALSNPSPYESDPGILIKKTRLQSGKQHISASHETIFEPKFTCWADSSTDISVFLMLVGYPNTLVIDGVSYTNMYIDAGFKSKMYAPGKWTYTIGFTQDTSL